MNESYNIFTDIDLAFPSFESWPTVTSIIARPLEILTNSSILAGGQIAIIYLVLAVLACLKINTQYIAVFKKG